MAIARSIARREAIYGLVALGCVVADQATKAIAALYLRPGQTVPLVGGLMDLTLTTNTGAAFSLGRGMGWLFALIAVAVVVILAVVLAKEGPLPVHLCVIAGVVAGGGIGNLIDRLFRGGVVDFLDTAFMDFPIFNVADICVSLGTIAGIVAVVAYDARRARAEAAATRGPEGASASAPDAEAARRDGPEGRGE